MRPRRYNAGDQGSSARIVPGLGEEPAAHGGDVTSLVLIPSIRSVTTLPIVAAGGFATGGALGATLFDASNNCNADGFACLLGAPLTATQLSECSAGVKRIAALTSNDFVRAKRMAVATIASSNFLCD